MRIRTVKPEFFTHEAIFEAEKETGFPLRIAFVGLWCAADREGRFNWEPRRLGVQILPYDLIEFSRVLDALVTRGFVVKYQVKKAWFGVIPSFIRHQVINNRESASVIPEPLKIKDPNACGTRAARVDDATGTEESGREGKGREGNNEDPPNPQGGNGQDDSSNRCLPVGWKRMPEKERKRTKVFHNTPTMETIGAWFRRGTANIIK